MRSHAFLSLVLLALSGACGPGTEPGDGDGSAGGTADATASSSASTTSPGGTSITTQADGSTTTGGGEALPPGCTCREPVEDGMSCEDLALTECEGEAICAALVGMCSRPNPDLYMCDPKYYSYDEAILACMLEALRDRTPGKLEISVENDVCGLEGCGSNWTEITIVPDERAVVRSCSTSPLWAESSSTSIDALAEPAHFDGCLALATVVERYECMRAGLTPGAALCE